MGPEIVRIGRIMVLWPREYVWVKLPGHVTWNSPSWLCTLMVILRLLATRQMALTFPFFELCSIC